MIKFNPADQDKRRGAPEDSKKEMTPEEFSSLIRNVGPVFEGEEERIEELILEGRKQPRDTQEIQAQ